MFYQFIKVASGKVGTAYTTLEQHITGEHTAVCSAIINQTARRVSRHVDCFQRRIAESNDITIVQVVTQRYRRFLQLETEHSALLRRFVNPEFICLVGFRFQPEFFQHKRIAEDMVQVQVCVQQMLYVQSIADDKVFQRLFFFFIEATGVYNDSFIGLDFWVAILSICHINHFLGLEELFLKEILQVPHDGFVLEGHCLMLQFPSFQAN